MTIDELKKEVEEWLRSTDNHLNEEKTHFLSESEYAERAYLAGAEPREKRIAELERKLKVETELSNRLGLAYREYEQLTKEQDEHLAELEKENAELKKQLTELKEFYEIEYFQISDRTADEKIKELEKHQVEVTIDDYSPYDENTWGMMHEEWFVPKEEVRDLLKENYALITKAKEHIRTLISCLIDWVQEGDKDYCHIADAKQFLNSEVMAWREIPEPPEISN